MNILLDMDGVLSDFLSLALEKLNEEYKVRITVDTYANYGKFDMAHYYGCSEKRFWEILERNDDFWCNLKPFPWAKELYEWLCTKGDVTICTSPSHHLKCAGQKMEWIKQHIGVENSHMMVGSRKHLMARPTNVLIDDLASNTMKFREAGGQAILVPSNWNTHDLTFDKVREAILLSL